jgi:cell division protein FtsI/penicillin-binding protein 2
MEKATIRGVESFGMICAAVMQSGYKLAIQPKVIAQGITDGTERAMSADEILNALNAITPIDATRFATAAAKTADPYEEIATHVSEDAGQKIAGLDMPGVVLVHERWRFYPAGSVAANMLGFVGFKGDARVGRYGLERYWEDTLARDKSSIYGNFFVDLFESVASVTGDGTGYEGDIITTIEPTVQQRLEDTLEDIQRHHPSRIVGGIVMDPKTGAIIAMASNPTFDPNTYNQATNPSVFSNPLVESSYELGSIMKPLTVAAGLDAGVITQATVYHDTGCIERSGVRVCNFDGRARGDVLVQEVLSQSLNVGATFVAEKLGADRFATYVRAFGLGEETGIDVPNEVPGRLSGLSTQSAVDLASASFGQGIALTPIAMTRALSALGNGGMLPEPHVVQSVRYTTGITKQMWHPATKRVISEEASNTITGMLIKVVDTALSHGADSQKHYTIAAKTGTAQMASPGGGYYSDRYLHSFFGYFPARNPRFIVFLFAVEPRGVEFASQSLTEPFMDMTKFLLNYYDVPPDR